MRLPQAEKMEVIRLVEESPVSVKQTLKDLGVSRSTFYSWYKVYLKEGYDGLAADPREAAKGRHNRFWNQIPEEVKAQVITLALEQPALSPRELAQLFTDSNAYFISESSVYRILKAKGLITAPAFTLKSAADEFKDKTTAVNELWQTDFTYFHIKTWGWYYLSTILDDYSRYILAWELCPTMKTTDVCSTLNLALQNANLPNNKKPKLLSDNGSCYISADLKKFLEPKEIRHIRSAPHHPMTQGKIERYHRSMKNILLLDFFFSPAHLKDRIEQWVNYYNNNRYHEALQNLTPADVYFGRGKQILKQRQQIKFNTLKSRRKNYIKFTLNLTHSST